MWMELDGSVWNQLWLGKTRGKEHVILWRSMVFNGSTASFFLEGEEVFLDLEFEVF